MVKLKFRVIGVVRVNLVEGCRESLVGNDSLEFMLVKTY